MIDRKFYVDDIEYTVSVTGYSDGCPARTNCYPGEGHEGDDWEITLDDTVSIQGGYTTGIDEFIQQYADEFCKGDVRRAQYLVEGKCRDSLVGYMEGAV